MKDIQASPLFCEKVFIGSEWIAGEDKTTIAVQNPANGEVIANVANCSVSDVRCAVENADRAWENWTPH